MHQLSIKEKIKHILIEELNLTSIDPEDIGDDDPIFGGKLGLDSIDAVELVFQIKQHFGVIIRDMKEGRAALETVNTLSRFIEQRLPN